MVALKPADPVKALLVKFPTFSQPHAALFLLTELFYRLLAKKNAIVG